MKALKVKTIDVHALKKSYDTATDLCLIDVREVDEWQALHIPGALHIPKDELAAVIEMKIPDRNRNIYLHCRGGIRSLHAADCLGQMGYTDVYSVDGGIIEWANSGYPVES